MPLNNNVHEHVSLNGLFVPFEKRLFGDSVNGLICDPYKSIMDAQTNTIDDGKLLPTVRMTDSVLWAGRDQYGRKAPSKYAREEVESGLPAQDCRPNAASRRTMERGTRYLSVCLLGRNTMKSGPMLPPEHILT